MKFQPVPAGKTVKRNIKVELSPDDYDQVKRLAEKSGVSLKAFVRQAVEFAVANMEK